MPEKKESAEREALGKRQLKNQNPNHQHNSKKEGLGPNTKR